MTLVAEPTKIDLLRIKNRAQPASLRMQLPAFDFELKGRERAAERQS